jgi:hypothetical protein
MKSSIFTVSTGTLCANAGIGIVINAKSFCKIPYKPSSFEEVSKEYKESFLPTIANEPLVTSQTASFTGRMREFMYFSESLEKSN